MLLCDLIEVSESAEYLKEENWFDWGKFVINIGIYIYYKSELIFVFFVFI